MAWRAGGGTVAPRLDAHPTLHWQPAPTQDYKLHLRLRLKAMADTETAAPGQPELLFVYLRPPALDAAAKGPARVFEAMKKDLNRRRERCVRLDPAGAAGTTGADAAAPGAGGGCGGWGVARVDAVARRPPTLHRSVAPVPPPCPASRAALLGLDEYERQLKDALRAAFEARAAAYAEEVRRLMLNRLDPAWSFSTLFLVKDGPGGCVGAPLQRWLRMAAWAGWRLAPARRRRQHAGQQGGSGGGQRRPLASRPASPPPTACCSDAGGGGAAGGCAAGVFRA